MKNKTLNFLQIINTHEFSIQKYGKQEYKKSNLNFSSICRLILSLEIRERLTKLGVITKLTLSKTTNTWRI